MKKKKSELEELFVFHITALKVPPFEREYKFLPTRKFMFDFAWPLDMIAVECEGGVWNMGRHTRPLGFISDCEKYNLAAMTGWRVLRFTEKDIRSGEAATTVHKFIADERMRKAGGGNN